MTHFSPGSPVHTFSTKSGKQARIRYPQWEDLDTMLKFINTLSLEDTYINMSGEQLTRKEEADFLCNVFKNIEFGDAVYLSCFVDGHLAGSTNITRYQDARERSKHLGIFGITVAKEYRGEGIGYQLGQTVIQEAQKMMPDLTLIGLKVFEPNKRAQQMYEKLGFTKTASIPYLILYKNEYIPGVLMHRKV